MNRSRADEPRLDRDGADALRLLERTRELLPALGRAAQAGDLAEVESLAVQGATLLAALELGSTPTDAGPAGSGPLRGMMRELADESRQTLMLFQRRLALLQEESAFLGNLEAPEQQYQVHGGGPRAGRAGRRLDRKA